MNPRLKTLVDPVTIISLLFAGSLTAVGVGGTLALLDATASPWERVTLDSIPDRFVALRTESKPEAGEGARARREEGKVGKKDARMALGKGNAVENLDRSNAENSVLLGVIGTTGALSGAGGLGSRGGGPGLDAEPVVEAPRSWFPTTLLWAPRLVTDDHGHGALEVIMPDQLTDWRVLGLSAAGDGSLSGDTLHIRTAKAAFVEPVLPDRLRVGDEIVLPVRVGNHTEAALSATLSLDADGLDGGFSRAVTVGPGRVQTERVRLRATTPGTATLHGALGTLDRTVHHLEVLPRGERVLDARSGVFGQGLQVVTLEIAREATHAELIFTRVPGPAGLVRAELGRGEQGNTKGDLAAAHRLGTVGESLLRGYGEPASAREVEALRALRLEALQGLVGTSGDNAMDAAIAVYGLRGSADPLASAHHARLTSALSELQLDDGSWFIPSGSALQALAARTAWIAPASGPSGSLRAAAVLERHLPRLLDEDLVDPYTAALAVRAGALGPELEARLREKVLRDLAGVEADPTLLDGLVRPDGKPVTLADARIAAALVGVGDAGGRALRAWTPARGFGDGFTQLMALELLAIVDNTEQDGQITLIIDGTPRALEPDTGQVRAVVGPGAHRLELAGSSGAGWHLEQVTWTPWSTAAHPMGLDARITVADLQVGQQSPLRVDLAAPRGTRVKARVALPAGIEIIDGSVQGGVLLDQGEGWVELVGTSEAPVSVNVVPSFAGKLWSGETVLTVDGDRPAVVPPARWEVGA